MRIVLIYPPPWKIHRPGEAPYPPGEGAPAGSDPAPLLDGDFLQAPYGLLSIAAQAQNTGHAVTTGNLANACWTKVVQFIRNQEADLFGLSCVTANRRGIAMTARLIRDAHPGAHIIVGGPHVSALPAETLVHYDAIDTVVMGEGEAVFSEVLEHLAAGDAVTGIAGTAWRERENIKLIRERTPIEDLDTLVPPQSCFAMRTILTSRGCPGRCTFCCSNLMWGRSLRFHSVDYVMDMLEHTVRQQGQPIVTIKDDTFTADRERVMAICDAICSRDLRFTWSCETRADCLDPEMLMAMRRAGCSRISIGVESASRKILNRLRKRIVPETVLAATEMAKDVGIQVRYYMMVGNRGETFETFSESLDFIARARPSQFVFTQFHLYPGTAEYAVFRRSGAVSPETFFDRDFMHLTCFAGKPEDAPRILAALAPYEGVQNFWTATPEDGARVLDKMGDLPEAHMDQCNACLRAGHISDAERHLKRSADAKYGLPGLIHNARACIAAAQGDVPAAEVWLDKALSCYPHQVVIDNLQRLSAWQAAGEPDSSQSIALSPATGFETSWPRHHPEFPEPNPLVETVSYEPAMSEWFF
ncbi:MAG: radical SAM protein [Pseudomonadota bacterium]